MSDDFAPSVCIHPEDIVAARIADAIGLQRSPVFPHHWDRDPAEAASTPADPAFGTVNGEAVVRINAVGQIDVYLPTTALTFAFAHDKLYAFGRWGGPRTGSEEDRARCRRINDALDGALAYGLQVSGTGLDFVPWILFPNAPAVVAVPGLAEGQQE